MNEKPIRLPSGGTAYVYDVVPHGAAKKIKLHYLRLQRDLTEVRDDDGGKRNEVKPDLTPEQLDAREQLLAETEEVYIRAYTLRWEDVKSGDGRPLVFPDDIGEMQEPDVQALAFALITGRADPNGDGPPSSSS